MMIPRLPRRRRRTQLSSARGRSAVSVAIGAATLLACLSVSNCRSQGTLSLDQVAYRNVGVSFQVSDTVQQFLQQHPSEYFWIAPPEPVFLSWEAVATAHVDSANYHVGACNNENVDTGGTTFDGRNFIILPWRNYTDSKFLACNPYVLTWNQTSGFTPCREVSAPCDNSPDPNFPFCAQACAQHPSTDTEFVVSIASTPGSSLRFSPSFAAVPNIGTFVDETTYDVGRSDATQNRLAFVWSVPTLFDGRWAENFSPKLSISRVRAFVPTSRTEVSDRPNYLNLVGIAEGVPPINNRCDPDPDDPTQVTVGHCPVLGSLVPTYDIPTRGPGLWKLDIPPGSNNNVIVDQNTIVDVEFTIANPLGQQAGPKLSPDHFDFGDVPLGQNPIFPVAFTVTNDGFSAPWTVDSITTAGPNASEFSAGVHGSRTTPFSMGPLGSFSIDVAPNPSSTGSKSATVQVQMHSANGQQRMLAGNLQAFAVDLGGILAIEPQSLYFNFGSNRLPWRLNVLISNDSGRAIARCVAIISDGVAATEFSVTSSAAAPVSNPPACPNVATSGLPVPPSTLQPGQSEVLEVDFCPSRRGSYDAKLVILANITGNAAAPIWAWRTVSLHGEGPPNNVAVCVPRP